MNDYTPEEVYAARLYLHERSAGTIAKDALSASDAVDALRQASAFVVIRYMQRAKEEMGNG